MFEYIWPSIDNPSLQYQFALEIANGIGFVLVCVLGVTLIAFLLLQIHERSWTVIWLTVGMIFVKIGLALGLGYRWVVTRCLNRDKLYCASYEDDSWLLFASVIVVAIGGLLIIRVLSRPEWRPWSWLSAMAISIVIPFIYWGFDLTDRQLIVFTIVPIVACVATIVGVLIYIDARRSRSK